MFILEDLSAKMGRADQAIRTAVNATPRLRDCENIRTLDPSGTVGVRQWLITNPDREEGDTPTPWTSTEIPVRQSYCHQQLIR